LPSLKELLDTFGPSDDDAEKTASEKPLAVTESAVVDGETKTASGGSMKSLTDIYLSLDAADDMAKEAAAAAQVPDDIGNDEVDFAKMAEDLAEREATDLVDGEGEEEEIIKVAAEYDAAGRIMARGFYDEFMKLAGNMDTDVAPNQTTESPSAASTPALGERGLVTVPTNYAGSAKNDQPIETAGPGPKQVYSNVLKTKKTISAGQGTGDDPEAAAISLGGGSPAGFATVRDLAGGNPA
jgi:hypothetical protein